MRGGWVATLMVIKVSCGMVVTDVDIKWFVAVEWLLAIFLKWIIYMFIELQKGKYLNSKWY